MVASVSGRVTLERRGTVHHRHAGEAYIILQRDLLAGELCPLDAPLTVVLKYQALYLFSSPSGRVARRPRIRHGREHNPHGIAGIVGGIIPLHQRVVGFELLISHMHAEIFSDAAQ